MNIFWVNMEISIYWLISNIFFFFFKFWTWNGSYSEESTSIFNEIANLPFYLQAVCRSADVDGTTVSAGEEILGFMKHEVSYHAHKTLPLGAVWIHSIQSLPFRTKFLKPLF